MPQFITKRADHSAPEEIARYNWRVMPIYEFTCNVCQAPLTVFVRSMSAAVNAKCEKCGSTDLTRNISNFAVLGVNRAGTSFGDADDAEMSAMMQQMGGMGGGMGGMDDFGDDF